MHKLLVATVSTIGLGIIGAGNVSAMPINGSAVQDTVNAASAVSNVYYYAYRHRGHRYYYRHRYYRHHYYYY